MKVLEKIDLQKAKVLSSQEMKVIAGGQSSSQCYYNGGTSCSGSCVAFGHPGRCGYTVPLARCTCAVAYVG